MAALVRQDPETGKEKASNEAVKCPKRGTKDHWQVGICQLDGRIKEHADDHEIADHVSHRADERALEAVCWDGVPKRLHVGDLSAFLSRHHDRSLSGCDSGGCGRSRHVEEWKKRQEGSR